MDEEFKDIPQSPLHSAVYYSHYSAVRFLVEKGFDVFRLNTEGRTPCQLADEDDHEIIDILRRAEANQRKVADERSTRVTDVSDDETVKGVVKKVLPRQHVQSGPTENGLNSLRTKETCDLPDVSEFEKTCGNNDKLNPENFDSRKRKETDVDAFSRKEIEKLNITKQKSIFFPSPSSLSLYQRMQKTHHIYAFLTNCC
jgi:ankyrin repeat protein